MPNRLNVYHDLLKSARDQGYETHSIYSFWQAVKDTKRVNPDRRYLILRHDVDTDPRTAEKTWNLEAQLDCTSSFFFRLCTFTPSLMKQMHAAGFEASYHYEEVSTVAKQRGFSSWPEIQKAMPQIRALFRDNLTRLRESTGLPMRGVASHGDFVNRKLNIINTVILEGENFRKELGIDVEAYDAVIEDQISFRVSDCPYPRFWKPKDPVTAIRERQPVVYILTHPRHWQTCIPVNAMDNVLRAWEGAAYWFKSATAANTGERAIAKR
jgi:hypothetical protein